MNKRKQLWDEWVVLENEMEELKMILQNKIEKRMITRENMKKWLAKTDGDISKFIKKIKILQNKTKGFVNRRIDKIFPPF
jgi:hypothetical protein